MSRNDVNGKMTRRTFIATSALAAPAAASVLTTAATRANAEVHNAPAVLKGSRKRNVLFISTDDMCNRLGCYGVPVRSPNLDGLSRRGVQFDHHYCQFPLCGPSRTSLMTGLAPDTTRCYDLGTDFRNTIPQTITLPQLFQKNGYFTGRAGKIYHYNNPSEIGTPGFDDAASWQQISYPAGYDRTHDEELVTFYAPQGPMSADGIRAHQQSQAERAKETVSDWPIASKAPWRYGGRGPSGIRISQDGRTPVLPLSKNGDLGVAIAGHPSDGDDQVITDYMVAEAAICMMDEHKHEPWFIGAGFFRPHVPFIVPSRYFDLYQVDDIQVPSFDPAELRVAPRIAYSSMTPNEGMNLQQHREAVRAYYAAISFVDAQVGRLLDALERLYLAKDTTVVFWADHGFMVGEHGQWEKLKLFEPSARVPFIMAGAGVASSGRPCDRTSEHLDIYPTLAELCDLEGTPTNLQGRSLVPLLEDPDASWDRPAITQVTRRNASGPTMGYSVRTERYRYTMWSGGMDGEELYDYKDDPRELKNLATDAASSNLKGKLRDSLVAIARSRGMSGDSGRL
ncbi:MAG TPA: sulfatase [Acidobacteriaceae bacterium]|nr:sulfatase [Acidobacteriaceae bacterium]